MGLVEKLQQWKEDLEELGVEKGRAEGRLEQAMASLKKMGFDSLDEAKAELERLISAKKKAEEEAEELLESFKEKYKDHIG